MRVTRGGGGSGRQRLERTQGPASTRVSEVSTTTGTHTKEDNRRERRTAGDRRELEQANWPLQRAVVLLAPACFSRTPSTIEGAAFSAPTAGSTHQHDVVTEGLWHALDMGSPGSFLSCRLSPMNPRKYSRDWSPRAFAYVEQESAAGPPQRDEDQRTKYSDTSLTFANRAIRTGYSTAPRPPPSLSSSSNSCAGVGDDDAASSKAMPDGPRFTQARHSRGEVSRRPPPVPIRMDLRSVREHVKPRRQWHRRTLCGPARRSGPASATRRGATDTRS